MSKDGKSVVADSVEEISSESLDLDNVEIKEVEIDVPSEELATKSKKVKGAHNEIVQRVENTKELATLKFNEYTNADNDLNRLSSEFIEQENRILNSTVSTSLELLKSLNVESLADASSVVNEIKKDNSESMLKVKTPSKGNFKGFTLGLIGTLATVAGALFYGAKVSNLPLNMATFMQKVNLDTIATKYANLINIKDTPLVGYALVGAVALVVGGILHKLVTWMQKGKNVKYADRIERDLEDYTSNIDNKIVAIDKLYKHIENIQLVMNKYDIILQEQNAKIRRMFFIEQPEDGINSLQRASRLEVEKTQLILDELLELMNTPVNDDVNIREESISRLQGANSVINEVIKKLYI